MENTELVPQVIKGAFSVSEMQAQINLIQSYMEGILKLDEHYGKIPGCGDKPTLLKSGAEKLCFAFNLRPDFEITVVDDPESDHREVQVLCRILNKATGLETGQGVGTATTKEGKWRFRVGVSEPTEFAVPKSYWKDRDIEELRKLDPSLEGLPLSTMKNDDGKWVVGIKGEKMEHDNPSDYYNTVLKMAKKRAMVDAVITSTAASDIFTQDIEEMVENKNVSEGKPPSKPKKKEVISKPNQEVQNLDDQVNTAQLKRIQAVAERVGWGTDDIKAYIKENFGLDSGKQMTIKEANELLKTMEPQESLS